MTWMCSALAAGRRASARSVITLTTKSRINSPVAIATAAYTPRRAARSGGLVIFSTGAAFQLQRTCPPSRRDKQRLTVGRVAGSTTLDLEDHLLEFAGGDRLFQNGGVARNHIVGRDRYPRDQHHWKLREPMSDDPSKIKPRNVGHP